MDYRYIDSCPYCRQGWVMVVREKIENKLMLVCDDCEQTWNSPESFYNNGPLLDIKELKFVKVTNDDELTAIVTYAASQFRTNLC